MKEFHVKKGPFMNGNNTTQKMMIHLFIALTPIILFAFYKNGVIPYQHGKVDVFGLFYPLIFIGISTLSTYFIEWFCAFFFLKKKKNELREYLKNSYAMVPGLFLALILPIHTLIPILIFGCVMATIIGKIVYGGFGNNIFNPAGIGRLFIITAYASVIASNGGYLNAYEVDIISTATPLSNVAVQEGIGTYETLVAPYGTLTDFFTGFIPGAIGETSVLLCVIAFLYLSITKVIKWRIPVIYIGTVFLLTLGIGWMGGVGIWYPLFQILSGGLFFGAVFMATDPVTSPVTIKGQFIYGIALGLLTVLFRYTTALPEGVLTSILTMNVLVFLIDKLGLKISKNKKIFWIVLFIIFSIINLTIYQIGNTYRIKPNNRDMNFEILDRKEEENKVIYTVTQKGNGGPIKGEITLSKGTIVSIQILSHNETPSYYALVEKEKYLDILLKGQEHLPEIDTVSGATISSNAMKKMIINVKADYGEHYE